MTYVSPALTATLVHAKLRLVGEHDIAKAAQVQTVIALVEAFIVHPQTLLHVELSKSIFLSNRAR